MKLKNTDGLYTVSQVMQGDNRKINRKIGTSQLSLICADKAYTIHIYQNKKEWFERNFL